jgi:hypothetical protein
MRCRFGVCEGAVGKARSLVDSTGHPQYERVGNLSCAARILAELVGEIRIAPDRRAQGFLKMVMGAGEIAGRLSRANTAGATEVITS